MPRHTMFYAQSFRANGRKLIASSPEMHRTEEKAIFAAKRLAAIRAGAVAISVTSDSDTEDYEPPVVVFRAGQVPAELAAD